MNGSCWIDERTLQNGEIRYDVRYRFGGRFAQKLRAGSFKSRRDAKARQAVVMGLLARNIDPRDEFTRDSARPTVSQLWPVWVANMRDVSESRRSAFNDAFRHIEPILGNLRIEELKVEHALKLIERMEKHKTERTGAPLSASTQKLYWICARQFVEQHGSEVFRSRLIRLPRVKRDEVNAMDYDEFLTIRREFVEPTRKGPGPKVEAGDLLLALDFIEATATRIGDAQKLVGGDVDYFEGKVRVSKARGKSASSRWVPVPRPLLDQLAERDVAADGLLLPELTAKSLPGAMRRACVRAGIRHFHPHDLRHRRASLWVYQGVPLPLVAQWVGHADARTTLEIYAHVVVDPRDVWSRSDYERVAS